MSEQVKISNKHIVVGEEEYRLTVSRKSSRGERFFLYEAHLSDMHSQFTTSTKFLRLQDLERGLRAWLIKADMLNNPETRVFEQIRRWDGVIQ